MVYTHKKNVVETNQKGRGCESEAYTKSGCNNDYEALTHKPSKVSGNIRSDRFHAVFFGMSLHGN
jgi:hypothetical protein